MGRGAEKEQKSLGSASICNHFKRGCEREGSLTDGTKANDIVVLLSNKASHLSRTSYSTHLKLIDNKYALTVGSDKTM